MLKKCVYFFVLLSSLSVLCGCATWPNVMSAPINQHSKVGVISFMSGDVTRVGGPSKLVSFIPPLMAGTIAINNFDYDPCVSLGVAKSLGAYSFSNVEIMQNSVGNPFAKLSLTRAGWRVFANEAVAVIKKVTTPSQYDYIIAIVPDYLDLEVARAIYYFKYGVAFNLDASSVFFAAYQTVIIDGKTYQILASKHGETTEEAKNITWPDRITENSEGILILKKWLGQYVVRDISINTFATLGLAKTGA